MSSFSLSANLIGPVEHVADQLAFVDNPLAAEVLARGVNLVLAPASFLAAGGDTAVGLGAGIGALCTLGTQHSIVAVAERYLPWSRELVAAPYKHLLSTINPRAREYSGYAWISADGNGFITHYVFAYLSDKGREYRHSDDLLVKHVASRLTYALAAVACLVARVADGAIGLVAGLFSFFSVGKWESLNNLAGKALQAPGIICDLFYCTIRFINPWAGDVRQDENDGQAVLVSVL